MSIPRIIHQCWIGPYKKPERLMKTWKEKNKNWEYIEWNEEKIKKIDLVNKGLYDEFMSKNEKKWYGAADILRYEVLYKYGGFWVDADSECINSLEDFFINNDSFACYQNEKLCPGRISNAFIGANIRNELMEILIKGISKIKTVKGKRPCIITGPIFLTKVVKDFKYDKLKIYPSYFFMPKHYKGLEYKGKEKIYARHYWGTTLRNKKSGVYSMEILKKC